MTAPKDYAGAAAAWRADADADAEDRLRALRDALLAIAEDRLDNARRENENEAWRSRSAAAPCALAAAECDRALSARRIADCADARERPRTAG